MNEEMQIEHKQQVTNYDVMCDLELELIRARDKFPSNEDLDNALVEEVGELSKALLEMKNQTDNSVTHEDVYKEAIQVAAMAIRIATEGIPNFPLYDPESGYRGKNWDGYKDLYPEVVENESD